MTLELKQLHKAELPRRPEQGLIPTFVKQGEQVIMLVDGRSYSLTQGEAKKTREYLDRILKED